MKQELKPCPFCEGEAKVRLNAGLPYVQCVACLVATQPSVSVLIAEERWNTRPDHSGESAEMMDNRWQHPHVLIPPTYSELTTEIDWEQRRWDVHRDANKIAMNVILMAQFELSKSDPDLAKQIDWKKMAEASMEFANEMSQSIVDSYQLKQQSNG